MKTKKCFLALLLSVAMLVSLCGVAWAEPANEDPSSGEEGGTNSSLTLEGEAEGGNSQKSVLVIPFTKIVKTTANDVALPTETFYFQMVPADDIPDGENLGGVEIQAGPALKTPVVGIDFDASDDTSSGEVTKDSQFDLTSLSFTTSGIYRYYITEVVKNEDGGYEAPPAQSADQIHYITYDSTQYVVDLFVDQPAGADSLSIVNLSVSYGDSTKTTKPDGVSFTNTIACANIEISKAAVGDVIFDTDIYDFYILIPVGGDTIVLKDGETLEAYLYNGDELVKDDRTNNTGKYILTVAGDGINADVMQYGTHFQLKSGEHLEIVAPVSMIYRVAEVTNVKDNFTTEAQYQESGRFLKSTTLSIAKGSNIKTSTYSDGRDEFNVTAVRGTTNSEVNSVLFINSRDEVPDTGIHLDILPYVGILAAAVILGGVCLVVKKRKAER
jgi:hypothetical protein